MKIDCFIEIEKKYDLNNISIQNVRVWNYLRFNIWNYMICSEKFNFDSRNSVNSSLTQYFKLLSFKSVFFKVPRNVDILFLNHERRIKNGDFYDCVYTEKLSSFFSNTATLEHHFEFKHYKPVKTNNLIYSDVICFKSFLLMRLSRLLMKKRCKLIRNEIIDCFIPAINEIEKCYNCKLNSDNIIEGLVDIAITNSYEKKLYTRLIKKLNPKLIVEVVYYAPYKMIINEISKELGIPSIELQHGSIYEEHLAYHYAKDKRIKQLPEKIFLFSDFWFNRISLPLSNENIISTGFPFFEDKINETKKTKREDDRYTILFVSQKTIGSYLSDFAFQLSVLLSSDEYRIIYKLHPGESEKWENDYPELKDSNIEVIAGNSESIYYYFSQSDMQIGVYSTAIYEGLGFDLNTLILKVGHYEAMLPLVELGYASFIENVNDVIDFIGPEKNNKSFVNDFWKKDALMNMIVEIKKICPDIALIDKKG